jgi:hypothetical protein
MAQPPTTILHRDEYSIEEITASHYPLLSKLYFTVFGSRESPASINRRFDTCLVCQPVIGFIAIHLPTRTAAAYYGVFPFKARIKGELVKAAQSGDTMTHPDHRRRGFFVSLAQLTYEECRKKGIRILIGQPNDNSYYGLVKKLGWTHLDQVVRWDMKLRLKTFPFPKITKMIRPLHNFYLSYAKKVLQKFIIKNPDHFHNSLQTHYARVERDKAYIDYKQTPDKFFIKIEHTIFWVRLTDIFWIGDSDNYNSITPSVINTLRRLAFRLGFNTISFNLNKSIPVPEGLKDFKKNSQQASCFLYLDESLDKTNFVLTAADSDTW